MSWSELQAQTELVRVTGSTSGAVWPWKAPEPCFSSVTWTRSRMSYKVAHKPRDNARKVLGPVPGIQGTVKDS